MQVAILDIELGHEPHATLRVPRLTLTNTWHRELRNGMAVLLLPLHIYSRGILLIEGATHRCWRLVVVAGKERKGRYTRCDCKH